MMGLYCHFYGPNYVTLTIVTNIARIVVDPLSYLWRKNKNLAAMLKNISVLLHSFLNISTIFVLLQNVVLQYHNLTLRVPCAAEYFREYP